MAAQCDKFKYEADIQMEKSITDFVYTTEVITLCILGLSTNGLSILVLLNTYKQNKLNKKSSYMVEFVGNSIKTASNILNVLIAKNRFDLLRGEQNLSKSTDKLKNFFQSIVIFLVVILVNVESILTIEINNLIESFELDYADFPIKNTFKNIFKNSFNLPNFGSLNDSRNRELQAMSHKLKVFGGQKKKISQKENFENRITYSVLFNCLILMVLRSFEFIVSLYVLVEIIYGNACSEAVKICSNISQMGNTFYLISCSQNLVTYALFNSEFHSFSENNIKKLQAIQNTAVRSILKLKYDTPSNMVHHEAFNKLKLLTVSNRLFELSERYVGTELSHSIPLVVRLVKEYKEGFESRYIEYPTPLCNCYLTISSYFPET
ncbi:hypothetical protein BpHYR1_028987 [Brachionus plicatilis]|uniref:Uncharacterized protein n=1 Tax=Brachionus plicatilis TaxID=10195 RepID=A0A3M7RNB3_BRAPC|nr:hypothetical protein BpHYR1_028987 [Brachionus plicatilis]